MDLRTKHGWQSDIAYLWAPWETFMAKPGRRIHLVARPHIRSGQLIEIVVPGDPLKRDLLANLSTLIRTSLLISLAAGAFVFLGLQFFIVGPIQRLTDDVHRFKTNPEDISIKPHTSRRSDEIGQIERELASMQEEVRNALRSRARLAALGQAVSKINHDLRNMLTSAQMASDRLAMSGDPQVAKALPRLERALDRALSLAQNVLTYGKSDEHAPQIQIVRLKDLADAAAEDAGLCLPGSGGEGVRFTLRAPKSFSFEADPEQMYRLLVNLMRNARQAIELQPNRRTLGRVTLTAVKTSEHVLLMVADNGPGIPEKLREKLFQPFSSSLTPGGTGLGLAIARELAQLHGGDVHLLETGTDGTSFEVKLPLKG
jgi:signal transduction histidine kinase